MPVDNATVKEILEAARDAVADLPEPLQQVGFTKAVDLLAAGAGVAANQTPPQRQRQERQASDEGDKRQRRDSTGASLQKIAKTLRVDVAVVENVYLDEDGELQIIVPASRLPNRPAPAMRDLIFLTALGRQAGGWDSGVTAITAAREVC